MAEFPDRYTTPAPLPYEPTIFHETRELINHVGGISYAIAETLRRAHIFTEITGDTSTWSKPGNGVIFIGDHRDGTESIPQVAAMASVGRNDQHFAANPYGLQARVVASLGEQGRAMLLPVIPQTMASDIAQRFDRHWYWRLSHRSNLPTSAEAKAINDQTLSRCAELAASGQSVTIFPAGGIMDATKHSWRPGIGEIIKRLPDESREAVSIVPIRAHGHSTRRLIGSIIAHRAGMALQPWTVNFELGQQGTVQELLGDTSVLRASQITEALRRQYVSRFG